MCVRMIWHGKGLNSLSRAPCPHFCLWCPALTEEQDSDPTTDQYTLPGAEPQAVQHGGSDGRHQEDFEEAHMSSPAQPQPQEAEEANADGWDFEDSALDGLGGSQPSQAHSDAASRRQYNDSHEQPSSAPVHAGEVCITCCCPKHELVDDQPHDTVPA